MSHSPSRSRTVPIKWDEIVLVCGKCSKKVHGGFGADGDLRLDRALRQELGIRKGRKGRVGFVRASCFDICPKNAVVVGKGSKPGRLHLIPRGTPIEEVAALLGLSAAEEEPKPPAVGDEARP